jgi:hypothetical protein
MTTLTLPRPRASRLTHALRELHDVQPALVVFALVMLAAMLPALVAFGLDERTLRGANVWAKPMKFMASVAVYALTTAWFVSLLPAARRHAAPVRWAVWTLIVTGGVEIAYITLQAALGQASHYNTTDALHGSLYTLMGVAAGVLTATQLVFAHELWRHGRTDRPRLLVVGASVGALLTFVLGAGAGGLLGGLQPPAGWGLPLVGWHLGGGDLRPAHFVGMHAQQALPLAAALLVAWRVRHGGAALAVVALAYALLWAAAMALGLRGVTAASFMPPL